MSDLCVLVMHALHTTRESSELGARAGQFINRFDNLDAHAHPHDQRTSPNRRAHTCAMYTRLLEPTHNFQFTFAILQCVQALSQSQCMQQCSMHKFSYTRQGPIGNDFDEDFAAWMKSAGLEKEFGDNAKATHIIDTEEQALIQLCGDPGLEVHDFAPPPPPHHPTIPPSVHHQSTIIRPPPWTLPGHIQVIPDGRAFDIVDIGSSVPRVIGRLGAQMQDGGVRCTCKLPGHSTNSQNQCYIWLKAPGHYAAAIACIGEWLSQGIGSNQTVHRTDADVQRAAFREFAWSLTNVRALCTVRACKRALTCNKANAEHHFVQPRSDIAVRARHVVRSIMYVHLRTHSESFSNPSHAVMLTSSNNAFICNLQCVQRASPHALSNAKVRSRR